MKCAMYEEAWGDTRRGKEGLSVVTGCVNKLFLMAF